MKNTVLIGAQWGDEGKGKVIDVLTEEADWVVRYQGGNNAGHTVEIGAEKYVLHLIPSGMMHAGKKNVIGNGMVIDPLGLVKELQGLEARGCKAAGRFFISDRAHMVLPFHKLLDEYRETKPSAGEKIGTTKRGIGPTYGDKAARVGVRMGDMLDPDFAGIITKRVIDTNKVLAALEAPQVDVAQVVADYSAAAKILSPYITDVLPLLYGATQRNEKILFEGAQGTLLDVDFGTYPFVTSSNTTAGGACTGTGVAPNQIDRVIGVVKAYATRVGEGPFPTELKDEMGERIRKAGNEFGSTTGRPRRCGWFDVVVAKYAKMINGINYWAVTKLDVLDEVETIKICVAYECDGKRYESVPANIRILERCKPVYEEVPGWRTSTKSATKFSELPPLAQSYIRKLAKVTGVPVGILSVGPKRASTMRFDQKPGDLITG